MSETGDIHVYKLLTGADWKAASAMGVTCTELDERDGYVHLSTRVQVAETARLHFAGAEGVRLLRFAWQTCRLSNGSRAGAGSCSRTSMPRWKCRWPMRLAIAAGT